MADYRPVEVEHNSRRDYRVYGITPPGTGSRAIVWNHGLADIEIMEADVQEWMVKGLLV